MDVTGIANTASALSAANTQQEISTAILKKAINSSAEGALSLIQAISNSPSAQHLPPHIGQNINTTA